METFDKADALAPGPATACEICHRPLSGSYFTVNGQTVCDSCRASVSGFLAPTGSALGRVVRAVGFGLAFGLVGTAVWYVVEHALNMHIGLVAILIGYLAGTGVSRGSNRVGGTGYQVLAVALTYVCICWAWVPDIADGLSGDQEPLPGFVTWPTATVLSLGAPFMGALSPMTALIGAFGMYEAWRRNRRPTVAIEGPFALSPAGGATAPAIGAEPSAPAVETREPLL